MRTFQRATRIIKADFLPVVLLPQGLMTGCMVGWPKSDPRLLEASAQHVLATAPPEQGARVGSRGSGDAAPAVAAAETVGEREGAPSCFVHGFAPPPLLHYCQHYNSATGQGFGKRAVPHGTLDECGASGGGGGRESRRASLLEKSAKSEGGRVGGGVDAATGARHSGQSTNWNTLAVCAVTRGIDHARAQRCLLADGMG